MTDYLIQVITDNNIDDIKLYDLCLFIFSMLNEINSKLYMETFDVDYEDTYKYYLIGYILGINIYKDNVADKLKPEHNEILLKLKEYPSIMNRILWLDNMISFNDTNKIYEKCLIEYKIATNKINYTTVLNSEINRLLVITQKNMDINKRTNIEFVIGIFLYLIFLYFFISFIKL